MVLAQWFFWVYVECASRTSPVQAAADARWAPCAEYGEQANVRYLPIVQRRGNHVIDADLTSTFVIPGHHTMILTRVSIRVSRASSPNNAE